MTQQRIKAAEKSRRIRNHELPEPANNVTRSDEWYVGFASAIAQIWRLYGDGKLVRHLVRASGLSLKHFEDAGVDEFDLAAICTALYGRRIT